MGPKKAAAPSAGQMSMTSFFMKKPAVQTPAVKEPAAQSGSSSAQDQVTPFAQDASSITSKAPPSGSGPALSDTATKKPESESKPVKRRLEEFASDEASDNDNAAVSSSAKKSKPVVAVNKMEKKEVGSPKKKAKTVAGAKSTSGGSSGNGSKARAAKTKANKKKMVIESDDEEKEWNEDDGDAVSASEEGDSASAFSEDESLEDSEDESLVDSDSGGDSESEEEEAPVPAKRKPAARKPNNSNSKSVPAAHPTATKKTSSPLSSFGANSNSAANTGSGTNPGSASKAAAPPPPLYLKEGVFNDGKHQHDTWDWLHANLKDKAGKRPTDQDYNPRTLSVPAQFLRDQTPAMAQWWQFKQENFDTVLFFKVGKFYELFHMDADVGMRELDLIYMKGEKAHSGFPEISYGKFANALVAKGYRVARVEQTETPEMLAARNKRTGGVKAKVVAREMCSVMSKGTRTYCHLDDCATTLEESSSSVLMCVKEGLADCTEGHTHTPEYGVCCVDTVLGTVTLAQFSDNSQRTRLRTMVSQFSPNEVLLEYAQHTDETRGVMRLLCPAAKTEELRAGEMPSASGAIDMLAKGGYFAPPGSSSSSGGAGDLDNWPVVLQAVAQGLESGSALAAMALGGATWLLKRSQIDYEVLSMGRVFGYVPPDDADNAVSGLVTSHAASASITAGQVRDLSSAGATAAMEQGGADADADAKAANSASSLLMGGTAGTEARTSMTMDAVTLSNLEVLVNNFDRSEKGSLWQFVNRCKTPFGRRLLKEWLCHPLYRAADIARRAAAVEELLTTSGDHADKARSCLKGIPDLERLLARVHSNALQKKKGLEHPSNRAILYELPKYNKNKIQDFAAILSGFEKLVRAAECFPSGSVTSALLAKVTQPTSSSATSSEGSNSNPNPDSGGKFPHKEVKALLAHFREIFDEKQAMRDGVIRPNPGMNAEYDTAKQTIARLTRDLEEYLVEMKRETGINDIKFFSTNKDRFQLEVPMGQCGRVPVEWTSKSQKKTHRRYWTPTIEKMLAKLVAAESDMNAAQGDTLRCIFEKFDEGREVWRAALACVALLDALMSLAAVSSAPNYCWPDITDRSASPANADKEDLPVDAAHIDIKEGRHPMLEYSLLTSSGGEYIPNSVSLGGTDGKAHSHYLPKLLLLSGPNMGGKSTLLRQTCLLAIMAQMGMKVPADAMKMSPVDRIFTRVGASDRILAGQSTFFVELAETAIILKSATQDSLCILDELGRGTATFDGTAIAHAVVDRLVRRARCRALFATHYHSLVDEWSVDARVKLGHMQCVVTTNARGSQNDDEGGEEEVAFLYHLGDGSSPKSYGINVARLAQLPAEVIALATQQSMDFEERLKRSDADHNSGSGSAMTVAARDMLYFYYDRLVSVVSSDMSLREKASVVRDVWTTYTANLGSSSA